MAPADPSALHATHVRTLLERTEAALAAEGYEAMVVHSGTPMRYHADDMDAPHHSTPQFAHWLPLRGPHHLLVIRPGQRPRLLRFKPDDYWYEQAPLGRPFWTESIDVEEVGDVDATFAKLPASRRGWAFVGDCPQRALDQGFAKDAVNPEKLCKRLDWNRSLKTDYEVECIERAGVKAAAGHHAAQKCFEQGGSELQIHHAYVAAVGCIDAELPYESIVALNEKGAILHYVNKRDVRDGDVLLLDCGATELGYASDITRTFTARNTDPRFVEMVAGMHTLEKSLCDALRPGLPYLDLHLEAHRKVGALLKQSGVLRIAGDEAVERGVTRAFFPHGLGHFLGIQVHDVSGHQQSPDGGTVPPPADHPFLRTTRTMEPGHVVTIEPGLYFIDLLLAPLRESAEKDTVDWKVVDTLRRHGGIRIEDDVLVTKAGNRNLTRASMGD